jgi:hypothetical protein
VLDSLNAGNTKRVGDQNQNKPPEHHVFFSVNINDQNNNEAHSTKLTILQKQWQCKYGDVWVLISRIEKGFW